MKILQRFSYSFLSITLSFNDFLFNLSKNLIDFWSFSFCFLYIFYLFMIISYNTLLPLDKAQTDAVDIGITIKSIPVRDNVIELDVVAEITKVSNDFSIVVIVFFIFVF